MEEFHINETHLAQLKPIGFVSSRQPGKDSWTEIAVYHRQGYNRPFVAVSKGVSERGSFGFKFCCTGTLERAVAWFKHSELTDSLRHQVEEWSGPEAIDHQTREAKLIEALRAIEDGEGDAMAIARQTLTDCGIMTRDDLLREEMKALARGEAYQGVDS